MNNNKQKIDISPTDIKTYSEMVDEATKEYYRWIRQILLLATSSLTVLVAFRNQILPEDPTNLLLLQISWFLFALSIILALFALRGYHLLLSRTARDFFQSVTNQKNELVLGETRTPECYRKIGVVVPWVFVLAVVFLTLFGILCLNQDARAKLGHQNKPVAISENRNSK